MPELASHLSLPIIILLCKGRPTKDYPYVWSINKWVDGNIRTKGNVEISQFAQDLARFLNEL